MFSSGTTTKIDIAIASPCPTQVRPIDKNRATAAALAIKPIGMMAARIVPHRRDWSSGLINPRVGTRFHGFFPGRIGSRWMSVENELLPAAVATGVVTVVVAVASITTGTAPTYGSVPDTPPCCPCNTTPHGRLPSLLFARA